MHTKEVHRQSPTAALRWLSARRFFSSSCKHKIPFIDTKHRIVIYLSFCWRNFPPRSPTSPPQGCPPGHFEPESWYASRIEAIHKLWHLRSWIPSDRSADATPGIFRKTDSD